MEVLCGKAGEPCSASSVVAYVHSCQYVWQNNPDGSQGLGCWEAAGPGLPHTGPAGLKPACRASAGQIALSIQATKFESCGAVVESAY